MLSTAAASSSRGLVRLRLFMTFPGAVSTKIIKTANPICSAVHSAKKEILSEKSISSKCSCCGITFERNSSSVISLQFRLFTNSSADWRSLIIQIPAFL